MIEVRGHTATMAIKRPPLAGGGRPHQKHELFPTPPWATRALFEHVLPAIGYVNIGYLDAALWDPCAGLGHMSAVLKEYAHYVVESDIICHGLEGGLDTRMLGIWKYDFLDKLPMQGMYVCIDRGCDWIITNPPFGTAHLFLEPALLRAKRGVAFFERVQWLESMRRYPIFIKRPPFFAPFSERVPLCEGGYDPDGSTASMYAWFVWPRNCNGALCGPMLPGDTINTFLIPPVCKKTLFKPSDLELSKRCVPGWVAPSVKRKARK